MKKYVFILSGLIFSICSLSITHAGKEDDAKSVSKPTTLCEMVQHLTTSVSRLEETVTQRIDKMDERISKLECKLAEGNETDLKQDVDKLKAIVGSFDGECTYQDKESIEVSQPEVEKQNGCFTRVRLTKNITFEDYAKKMLSNGQYPLLEREFAEKLIEEGSAVIPKRAKYKVLYAWNRGSQKKGQIITYDLSQNSTQKQVDNLIEEGYLELVEYID